MLLIGPGANDAAEAAQLRVRRDSTLSTSISQSPMPERSLPTGKRHWKKWREVLLLNRLPRAHTCRLSSSSAYVPGELEPTPFDSTTVAPPAIVTTTSPNPEVALLRRQTNAHLKVQRRELRLRRLLQRGRLALGDIRRTILTRVR